MLEMWESTHKTQLLAVILLRLLIKAIHTETKRKCCNEQNLFYETYERIDVIEHS